MSDPRVTLSGKPASQESPAPQPLDERTGMHGNYWILSDEERAKGFVRPVRISYKHVGYPGPVHPLRDLTGEEMEFYEQYKYLSFEAYPKDSASAARGATGRFWTQEQLDKANNGCGSVTTMNTKIAESYAAQPTFYDATFCAACRKHLPVGPDGEFVWLDGTKVGS